MILNVLLNIKQCSRFTHTFSLSLSLSLSLSRAQRHLPLLFLWSAENANDRFYATRPNRILFRKKARCRPSSSLSNVFSLKSIQRYVIEWPFFSNVHLEGQDARAWPLKCSCLVFVSAVSTSQYEVRVRATELVVVSMEVRNCMDGCILPAN